MNLYELVRANNLKAMWESDENRAPYPFEALFPNTRQKGLKFSFIKGKQNTPVALVSANWNTNVLYRDRIGVETLSGSLPFFKEAYKIDEETRQELLSVKDEYLTSVIDRVFDDELELLDGADVTAERMRAQLLSTGTITITENGVSKQYDYGFDSSKQYKTLGKLWSASDADPIKDIMDEIQNYEKLTGKTPTAILMDKSLFRKIQNNAKVLSYFANLSTPNLYPSYAQVLEFVQTQTSLRFGITEKSYRKARDFNGNPIKYYPEDRFTLLSTLDLGETVYGTTPEEADLLNKNSKASSVAVTAKGVAITTWEEVDPVNVITKVSEVCIPTCPNIDTIYIVKAI